MMMIISEDDGCDKANIVMRKDFADDEFAKQVAKFNQ